MIINDMNKKVGSRFFKEITIEDAGDNIVYVFPHTKEFLSIIKRKLIKEELITEKKT